VLREDSLKAQVVAAAEQWRLSLEPERAELIGAFFELLMKWNTRVNLTGARSPQELVGEHLVDSLALATVVSQAASMVDVGSGGGLPAIPFAVLRPDCHVTMVEPRAKRTAFLATAQRLVGSWTRLSLVRGRHEDLKGGGFAVAVSRATFQPAEWLRIGAPLVRSEGELVVLAAEPLGFSEGFELVGEVSYRTALGSSRWAGRFVPRGTTP